MIDHIKPLALGGDDSDDNCRALCHEHHAARTAEQFGLKAPAPVTGLDGWPIDTTAEEMFRRTNPGR